MLSKNTTLETAIDICKRYLNNLSPELDIRRAFIFGSYAKGAQKEDSDIAVVFGHLTA